MNHFNTLCISLVCVLAPQGLLACAEPPEPPESSVPADVMADVEEAGLSDALATPPEPVNPWSVGPYTPAHATVVFEDPERDRVLTVEIWYPSEGSEPKGDSTASFEMENGPRAALELLLEAAPQECPTRQTIATRNGVPATALGPRPLVLFSHCLNCGRYSSFSLAQRLASHGMVVVAGDHAGALPFIDGPTGEDLDADQLGVRTADVLGLLDAAIDGTLFDQSPILAGLAVDPDRIGAFGHSFGAVTTAKVAQEDPRVQAIAGLTAPMASILFPSVSMSEISVPLLLVLAEEDNSIMEIGNEWIRNNAAAANPPVWRVDIADAGHWSVSDLCGLTEAFFAGCGADTRHSEGRAGESFEYVSVARGIEVVQRYLATFFLGHLTQNPEALALLEAPPEEEGVTVDSRLE
jgi:predicted dienelactone hydrolase